ncbi:alginate lyase family protein [bacterium AH-315-P15]|nr:alginate lyase family protein [bacterium AH-315-P15]
MPPLATIGRYWQTVRWLKPVQLYGRVWFRLFRPRINEKPPPLLREASGPWCEPAHRAPSLTGPGAFFFLNEPGELASSEWDDPGRDKLWRYNQHYFDDLNAHGAPSRSDWHADLFADWIVNNPPGEGSGWEPYPTSLRIVNWIKFALSGGDLSEAYHQSLAVQARWLHKRLEWHLLGNHLFSNAKALIFAGLWFDGLEASAWLEIGFRILAREVPEQIFADGGQFELSPMYHALAFEDLLDLVNVTRCFGAALSPEQLLEAKEWATRLAGMQHWLAAMSHPDGAIAFFNDAAFGIAPDNTELIAYADRLGVAPMQSLQEITWLSDSGYVRLNQPNAVLIADMAPVGPDYLPGHGHADILSFELSLFGERLIVNSGTSIYGVGAERQRQRGTPAHSTVTIEGQNSSDVWSGFRVGHRANLIKPNVSRDGNILVAQATHDGYHKLPGHPHHRRRWQLSPGSLKIEDTLTAPTLPAEARFHIHPSVSVTKTTASSGTLTLTCDRAITWHTEGDDARIEASTWHPEFGKSEASTCIVVPLKDGYSNLDLRWS